jgi:REP element-mobilizing transposase RayT
MSGIPFPKRTRLPHEVYGNRGYTFHVVFRAMLDTAPFRGELGETVWALAVDEATRPSVRILAACLMPDHLHVVAQPGDVSLIRWVNNFKSYSTRLSWGAGRRGALWQPGFFDHLVRDDVELEATIGYVLRNPVERRLGDSWPWVFERGDRVRA